MQVMDEFLFLEHLQQCQSTPEETKYLEILNYSEPDLCPPQWHKLSIYDFENFLTRKGTFAPLEAKDEVIFANGIRLVLHEAAEDPKTFSPRTISFATESYEVLVREMKLPFRAIETSSAVGPFFWWTYDPDPVDPVLQIVFRKSDVQWKGNSRGWEMTLSYSFRTQITSGYVKGTISAKLEVVLKQLVGCARPVSHPLLLPLLVLNQELSSTNDQTQREAREQLRELENALSDRYNNVKAAAHYAPKEDLELDSINRQLADCQCKVFWKRPQAWRNVVNRLTGAADCFWDNLPQGEKGPKLQKLHQSLLSRLEFLAVKLEGLEHYAHVSMERLHIQREVMRSIVDQRESRLNLLMAIQQGRLADASRRDSTSMKTLTLLGSMFLPGAFLSSLFSTSFFNFTNDIHGSVSSRLWIYFAVTVPLTVLIVGTWWLFDRRSARAPDEDGAVADAHMNKLEVRVVDVIRERMKARVRTWDKDQV